MLQPMYLVVAYAALTAAANLNKWARVGPADKDATVTLRFALRAASSSALDDALASVADIHSPTYGQFLTDVSALVHPSTLAISAVESFLHAHNVSRTHHGDYIRVAMPVADAEALFDAELFEYAHEEFPDRRVVRPRGTYKLPPDVEAHVLLVDGLDAFPTVFQAQRRATSSSASEASETSVAAIQRAYDLPSGLDASDPRNAIIIGAFLKETFNEGDVEAFMTSNQVAKGGPSQVFHGPQPVHCIGDGAGTGTGEASLDTQLVAALTQSQHASVLCYNANRLANETFDDSNQEPFLTFMQDVNAMEPPPAVVSISYADDECALPPAYMAAVDVEFKKAGVRGTTIVVSSGDNGIVGSTLLGFCGTPACSRFQPQYPASSPYVLSVGATRFVGSNEVALSVENGGAITTGAGFSDYINRADAPPFQSELVETALASLSPDALGKVNPAGRAFPDVVAIGHNVAVFVNGGIQHTDGTSVSAPVVASLLAHVNKWRLDHGKTPLGYVVPYLYKLYSVCPEVFKDITTGVNNCGGIGQTCCSDGLHAGVGYDLLTGLGALQYGAWVAKMETCEATMHQVPAALLMEAAPSSREGIEATKLTNVMVAAIVSAGVVAMIVGVVTVRRRRGCQTPCDASHYVFIH